MCSLYQSYDIVSNECSNCNINEVTDPFNEAMCVEKSLCSFYQSYDIVTNECSNCHENHVTNPQDESKCE